MTRIDSERARALRLEGWKIDAIAAELGCGRSTVSAHTKGLVYSSRTKRLTPEQRDEIVRRRRAGESVRSIARACGVHWTLPGQILRRME